MAGEGKRFEVPDDTFGASFRTEAERFQLREHTMPNVPNTQRGAAKAPPIPAMDVSPAPPAAGREAAQAVKDIAHQARLAAQEARKRHPGRRECGAERRSHGHDGASVRIRREQHHPATSRGRLGRSFRDDRRVRGGLPTRARVRPAHRSQDRVQERAGPRTSRPTSANCRTPWMRWRSRSSGFPKDSALPPSCWRNAQELRWSRSRARTAGGSSAMSSRCVAL